MIIDLLFVILLISAFIKGISKGLIMALFSLVASVIGLAAALKLSAFVAAHLKDSVNVSARWLPFISFLLVFITVVILVKWCGKILEKTFEFALAGWLNKIGGILFYAIMYIIIFSVFLFYADKIHLFSKETFNTSSTYSFIKPIGPLVINGFGIIIPIFKDLFAQLEDFFASLPGKVS